MKLRIWTLIIVTVVGAVVLGYWSGRYHERQYSQLATYKLIDTFISATDVDTYLRNRGQEDWLQRLRRYGLMAKDSYIHVRQRWTSLMLFGLLCVAGGLFGLGYTIRAMGQKA